jgi:hypothetical protein
VLVSDGASLSFAAVFPNLTVLLPLDSQLIMEI